MDFEIRIDKRLYEDIEQYCQVNGLDIGKYCTDVLRKQLTLDKYGDLNEKFTPKEKQREDYKTNIIEPKPITKPKPKEMSESVVEIPQELPNENKRKHRIIETK